MSNYKEDGISIEISRVKGDVFIKLKMSGTLTHEDYSIMIPVVENAIAGIKEARVRALIDARDFEGWEARAMWDDVKFVLGHSKEFAKIALIGNKTWEEYVAKVADWFISPQVEFFKNEDDAMAWVSSDDVKLDVVQREIYSREDEIRNSLELLFKANMKITDWDVPEANDQEAAEILLNVLSTKLDEIKEDVEEGKYKNY